MRNMTTLDGRARDDVADRPWYIAAYRGRDVINPEAFASLRTGRRLTSHHWKGFRLFNEPSYMIHFGYAHLYMPWEVWEVKPTRLLRFEPTTVADFADRQVRARRLEVVQRMPPGFEFGPNGAVVRRLVERLAQAPQQPPTARPNSPEYAIAMTFLEDQCFQTEPLHDPRVAAATAYLDHLVSRSHTGRIERWNRHLPAAIPVATLLDAAVAGLPIPDVVADHWSLARGVMPQGIGDTSAGRAR
jgi:hypothetical protein